MTSHAARQPFGSAALAHVSHSSNVEDLLPRKQFDFLRMLAMRHAGISIADYKRNMVYRRVSKRLTALGIDSFDAYCAMLEGPKGERELQPLINALTTNKTDFFREQHHFTHLANIALPRFSSSAQIYGRKRLRIWSAGCSSGQEPYSIAMTLREALPDLSQWDARILATDIDTDVLTEARQGIYNVADTGAIPAPMRTRYLETNVSNPKLIRIQPCISMLVMFKMLNLHDVWPMKGPFDIIFCRNVVIYFDKPTQKLLFDRFADILGSRGLLYIGHSESLYRVSDRYQPVGQGIYEKIQ